MFLTRGHDKRIKNPFVRRVTYPIIITLLVLFFTVPMAFGLLGVVGLFLLLPGFVITYIWAAKKRGFPPH
jgi:amino acid permease